MLISFSFFLCNFLAKFESDLVINDCVLLHFSNHILLYLLFLNKFLYSSLKVNS